MKKLIARILTALFVSTAFAGCSSGNSTKDTAAADSADSGNDAAQATETVSETEEAEEEAEDTDSGELSVGQTWTVEGLWEVTVDSVTETQERNEYSDKKPAAVYIVTYTVKNIGYEDDIMDGLYITLDSTVVDSQGIMGYSYPGSISNYPQAIPVGATGVAECCIGVDNAGLPIKLNVRQYGKDLDSHKVTFVLDQLS